MEPVSIRSVDFDMDTRIFDEIADAVRTEHPARPFLLAGGILGALGLVRNSLGGVVMLAAGAVLIGRGMEELARVRNLHGGNAHGVNLPPANV